MMCLRNGLLLCLLLCYYGIVEGSELEDMSDKTYYSIPPIFHLDDYDRCMAQYDESLYCYMTMQLEPSNINNVSKTWRAIQDIIKSPTNYRHDRLRHGICLPQSCPSIPADIYKNGSGHLSREIESCYVSKYRYADLSCNLEEIHCEGRQSIFEVDYLDISYVILIGLILVLVAFGTLQSFQQDKLDEVSGGKILNAFSLVNNWKRLCARSENPNDQALVVIQGIRVYNIVLVVFSHTLMVAFHGPVLNVKYAEQIASNPFNSIVTNGGLVCQTFYLIAGWLVSYNFCKFFHNRQLQLQHLLLAVVHRFVRLIPVLLMTIGFYATWLRHSGRGPLWEHYVGDDFRNCRKNWIWTVLFLNNYVDTEKICLQQTWYLSGDTQAFVFALPIMALVLKKRQYAKRIFAIFIFTAITANFLENYYSEYDAIVRSHPEHLYTLYLKCREWLYVFSRGHHNFATYVYGLACGYYYYEIEVRNKLFRPNKFQRFLLHLIMWITPLATLLYPGFFLCENCQYTKFHASAYQAVSRTIYVAGISVTLFCTTGGIAEYYRAACSWKPLDILGRLTYSVFLTHTIPLKVNMGILRTVQHVSNYYFFKETISDVVVSFAIATVVCLTVEMPMSALQKQLLDPKGSDEKKKTKVN